MVSVVVSVSAPSVDVALTERSNWPEYSSAGFSEMPSNCQFVMSTSVLPLVAVKLFVPSVMVAPTGMLDSERASVSEPSASLRFAAMSGRSMDVFSMPEA